MTSEDPQGSNLGPVLWNAMYDVVLRLEYPVGVEIVGFADDITLEVYDESIEEVELTTDHSIRVVEAWIISRKLELAHQKIVVTVVINRKSVQQALISLGDCTMVHCTNFCWPSYSHRNFDTDTAQTPDFLSE